VIGNPETDDAYKKRQAKKQTVTHATYEHASENVYEEEERI